MEVFEGGVLRTAVKRGVPQARLRSDETLSGVLHLLQFHTPPVNSWGFGTCRV